MPIEKIPIVHKFGIVSQTHQEDIKNRYLSQSKSTIGQSPSYEKFQEYDTVKALLFRVDNETDELCLQQLEEKLHSHINRAKHQLLTSQTKLDFDVFKRHWVELTVIASCQRINISEAALLLLKESLLNAPLTKNLIECVLEVSLKLLQLFLLDQNSVDIHPISNISLKQQVCGLAITRLHYHHMARNINESHFMQMEALYLINLGVKASLPLYEEHPDLMFSLTLTTSKVALICHCVEIAHQEFPDEKDMGTEKSFAEVSAVFAGSLRIPQFLWDSLLLWRGLSRNTKISVDVTRRLRLEDLQNLKCQTSQWLDFDLAFRLLTECAKLNLNYLFLILSLSLSCNYLPVRTNTSSVGKPTSQHENNIHDLPPTATSNTPNIIQKIQTFLRDEELETKKNKLMKDTEECDDVSVTSDDVIQDVVVDDDDDDDDDDDVELLKLDSKVADSCRSGSTNRRNRNVPSKRWDYKLMMSYLLCLRDICYDGLSIDIQKTTLVGDQTHRGLVDFLKSHDGEESWKIRCCTYIYLKQLYYHFLCDHSKDGLKNYLWKTLIDYERVERDVRILKVIKNQVRSELSQIKFGKLFSKIATNLCIMILPPDARFNSYKKSRDQTAKKKIVVSSPRKLSPRELRSTKPDIINKNTTKSSRYEHNTWREMQQVATDIYYKEVREDEIELERLKLEAENEAEKEAENKAGSKAENVVNDI